MLMTKALDYFDPAAKTDDDLSKVLSVAKCDFLLVSFSTDWRFSPERSEEIVDALVKAGKHVSYARIEASQGHDAFLFPLPRYMAALTGFLNRTHNKLLSSTNKEAN